jgi:hypothetical protein
LRHKKGTSLFEAQAGHRRFLSYCFIAGNQVVTNIAKAYTGASGLRLRFNKIRDLPAVLLNFLKKK